VRYLATKRFLDDLGCSNVRVLPDIDLMLNEEPCDSTIDNSKPCVGIVLTPHSMFSDETFRKIETEFLKFVNYVTREGKQVIFFTFDNPDAGDAKELELIHAIKSRATTPDMIFTFDKAQSPHQILYGMKKYCGTMVCMRMHSAVFAANAGIPFICVSYNLMHKGLVEMLNMHEYEIELDEFFSFERIKDRYLKLVNNYDELKSNLVLRRNELIQNIHNEVKIIKGILEERKGI
jgi:polysaccharide pyruvyl transferase WcaK-like protein